MKNETLSYNMHACFFYSFNKRIQCADPRMDHQSTSFIFFATNLTSSCNTCPWTAGFFHGFYIDQHILNLNKAFAMQFSQNKELDIQP